MSYRSMRQPRPLDSTAFLSWALKLAERALVGLIALVAVMFFSPLNTPVLQRDEGVFVYIGRLILQGKLPYRDAWDHKGPLIYYINALGLWIDNNTQWGVWLVEALTVVLALILLYGLLRQTLSAGPAMFGLVVWLAGFAIVVGGNVVEEYALLPATLSLWIAIRRRRPTTLFAGMLAAILFMLRPNEAAAPLVTLAFLLSDAAHSTGWQGAIRGTLEFAAGFLIPALAVVAFFWWNNGFDDFARDAFLFNLYYVSRGGSLLRAFVAGIQYLILPVFFALCCLPLLALPGRAHLSAGQRRLFLFAAALSLVDVPLSIMSGRVYRHYYIPWLLPLSIFSGYSIYLLRSWLIPPRFRAALVLLCWSVLLIGTLVSLRIRFVPVLSGSAPPGDMVAIRSVQSFVPPGAALFIWGNETSYAVTANRTIASHFVYLTPIITPYYGEPYAREVLEDIQSRRPIIIDTSPSDPDTPPLDGGPPFPFLSDIYIFVHENYTITGMVAGKNWVVWTPK